MLRSGRVLPGLIGESEPLINLHANGRTLGRNNITTLAVGIAQQGQMRAAIWIIFQTFDFRRNTILVATEINDTIMLLVATTLMTNRNAAMMVTASISRLAFQQRCVRRTLVQVRR